MWEQWAQVGTFKRTASPVQNYINPNAHNRGKICPHYFQRPIAHKVLSRGQICPHYFQRPIAQKVLKCKKSAKIIYFTEKVCWIIVLGYGPLKKMPFNIFFMPQNRPMPEKCGLTVYSISHRCLIFGHIQVGGRAGAGGGGKSAVSTKQSKNPFTVQMRLFICWLSVSQTSWALFTWIKRCSILYVDSKKCEQN